MYARSSNNGVNQRVTKIVATIAVSILVLAVLALLFLPNASDCKIELKVVGKDMRVIKPGEATLYPIRVENKGKVSEDVRLETFGTPEGWFSCLDKDKVNIDSGERKYVFLTVKSPSKGTRGTTVASIGVRAWVGTGKTGTNNATLIKTVTWSYNYDKVTKMLGDYENPTRIETTIDSAVVYKLPDNITVKHIDKSKEYNGTTFWRNISVPVNVSVIISTDSIFEMGYVGTFNYTNRDNNGNPIQHTVELKSKIIKGTVYTVVKPKGTRGEEKNPLIEILSKTEDNTTVGSIEITIPMDTSGGIFSAGITDNGKAKVEVYDGKVDLEVRETKEKEPIMKKTIEPRADGAPQGISIEKIHEEVNVTAIDKNVVTITGNVEVLNKTITPPIEISSNIKMIFIDVNDIKEFNIDAKDSYKIEVKFYRKEILEVETIRIEGIEKGGVDTFKIDEKIIEIKTTSEKEKTVKIIIEKGAKRFEIELPLVKDEDYVMKDIDLEKKTATIIITDKEGKKIVIKNLPSGTNAEKFKEKRKEAEKEKKEFPIIVVSIVGIVIILIIIGVAIAVKKGKKEEKEVKELWEEIEKEEIAVEEKEEEKEIAVEEKEEEKEIAVEEKEEEKEIAVEEEKEEEKKALTKEEVEEIYVEGVEFYKDGEYELALEKFEMTIKADPNHERAWFNKGFVLRKLDRNEEALECFDKAIELKPDYEKAWYSKGFTLRKLERFEEALTCFEKALEINPEYENAKKGVEICKEELGLTNEEEVEFEMDEE